MKHAKLAMVLAVCAFIISVSGVALAADDSGAVKQELAADKQAVQDQKAEMKTHAEAAKAEEKAMRGQIAEANKTGDIQKAKELKQGLKAAHKENVAERKADKKELQTKKKELRQDKKALIRSKKPTPKPAR